MRWELRSRMTSKAPGEAGFTNRRERIPCILCDARTAEIVETFPFRSLRQLWFDTCDVDITTCLEQPYNDSNVYLYRCGTCELEFYPTSLCGTASLYQALGSFSYYYSYPGNRWEFDMAAKDVRGHRNILEIGCGTGVFLERMIREDPGRSIVGLELNPDAVQVARQKGLQVQACSLEQFAFYDPEAFDAVCAFQVLEHVPDPRAFLESAFRCLRVGGLCIITVPNAKGFAQYAINDLGNVPPHHLTRWTADVMRRVARMLGATAERILVEPVADYHKAWYRTTMTVKLFSAALRLRWHRIEVGTMYRIVSGACHRFQKIIPSWVWRYKRFPGHTLYVAFRRVVT